MGKGGRDSQTVTTAFAPPTHSGDDRFHVAVTTAFTVTTVAVTIFYVAFACSSFDDCSAVRDDVFAQACEAWRQARRNRRGCCLELTMSLTAH